jgi:hypothetical protein
MGKDKKHKPTKVGKKIKAGSKGPEPEVDQLVEDAKARIAEKRAAREREAADAKAETERPSKKAKAAKADQAAEVVETGAGREFVAPAAETPDAEVAERGLARARRIEELDAILADPDSKKKAKAAATDEKAGLLAELDAIKKAEAKAKATAPITPEEIEEAAGEGISRLAELTNIVESPDTKPKARKKAEAELAELKRRLAEESDAWKEIHKKRPSTAEAATAEVSTPAISIPSDGEEWPTRHKGNGSPKILLPDGSGKEAFYSRVTTYIDALDDKSALSLWGRRVVLTGAARDGITDLDSEVDPADTIIGKVAAANAELEAELVRIEEKHAAGEYGVGGRELDVEVATKTHKDAVTKLAAQAFDLGEGFAKASKGTNLHALTDLVDSGQKLPEDTSPEDRADIEAYQAAVKEAGLKPIAQEMFIVNDEFGIAGTLDRVWSYKRPGAARAVRVIGDLKTGGIEFGTKIPMQLAAYAGGVPYVRNIEGHRGPRQTVSKAIGLLIHLPQGKGVCAIYEVDLALGLRGLRLVAEVRAWRREAKPGQAFVNLEDLRAEAAEIEAKKTTDAAPAASAE